MKEGGLYPLCFRLSIYSEKSADESRNPVKTIPLLDVPLPGLIRRVEMAPTGRMIPAIELPCPRQTEGGDIPYRSFEEITGQRLPAPRRIRGVEMVSLDRIEPAVKIGRPRRPGRKEPKGDPEIPVPLDLQPGCFGLGIGGIEVVGTAEITIDIDHPGLRLRAHFDKSLHAGIAAVGGEGNDLSKNTGSD